MTPREQTQASLRKAADFLPSGGVAGIFSRDGSTRCGESLTHVLMPDQILIQPPGTPAVGEALLRAHRVTNDLAYLKMAREVGLALAKTQQDAGGWRRADTPGDLKEDGLASCTFDDDTTTAALRFLVHLAGQVSASWLRKSIGLALHFMWQSQYPNGAWPQGWPLRGDYRDRCTFNDGVINNCITTLLEVHTHYNYPMILQSALSGGAFIIASQLPEPQAGWPQQCDQDMKPTWGRAFEPPGVCSLVTARNIGTLIKLRQYTGDDRWLSPINAAVWWLREAQLPSGVWSRLYDWETGKPIYGNEDGEIHYDAFEACPGYKWEGTFGVPGAIKAFENLKPPAEAPAIIDEQDEHGGWPGDDGLYRIGEWVANVEKLCDHLEGA